MEELDKKLTCLRIFIDMDHLVIDHLKKMHVLMEDLTENIPTKLSTKVGDKELGIHFIEIVTEMDKFKSRSRFCSIIRVRVVLPAPEGEERIKTTPRRSGSEGSIEAIICENLLKKHDFSQSS